MSTRETILAAFASALSGVAGGRVYRERREQIAASGLPAVVVEPRSEEIGENVIGRADHRLEVVATIYASGDVPSTAADATLAAVHAAIMADPGLGQGSDVQVDPNARIDWDIESYDEARAALTYTINYRTALGAM